MYEKVCEAKVEFPKPCEAMYGFTLFIYVATVDYEQ